ncbi:helix-turn-helix domain-containing protein [Bacillus sp. CGMCC 1.16541]|uniref:helix-turn-helix domain-containing protein n=1 Tax=Bacillus sp. CGMCC 1.16541 TaxID=2185143 RepID=UPI000D72D15C|nr:helix-turn-helix domain-containing protein [Bacillus sp. CGMCC 1.16541]
MSYIAIVILYCIEKFKGERTVFGVYHLLVGKKSAQTIQDSKLYRLSFLFQSFSYLNKQTFSLEVKKLIENELIMKVDEQKYIITTAGQEYLNEQLREHPFPPSLNGWQFTNATVLFIERLTLLFQTLSNLQYFNRQFIPVTKNEATFMWVKDYLLKNKANREDLATQLYEEMKSCLQECSKRDADLFVLQLTGYEKIGFTKHQVAAMYEIEESYVHLLQLGVVHKMIHLINDQYSLFPVLSSLLKDLNVHLPITASTLRTFSLLKRHYSIEEIASIRRLKVSTIEDHIAELALLVPDFTIDSYVSVESQLKVKEAVNVLETHKLKDIKEHVGEDISYFQIRIVLAKWFA